MTDFRSTVFVCQLCMRPFDMEGEAVSHFVDKHTDDEVHPPIELCVFKGELARRCVPHHRGGGDAQTKSGNKKGGEATASSECDCTQRVVEERCSGCGHEHSDHTVVFLRQPWNRDR